MKLYNVGILGATGAVGQEMMKILLERKFPVGELRPIASARSAGSEIDFGGRKRTIVEASDDAFEGLDIVLGADWIAKRMRDLLYDMLLENANINYGDDGFGLIATAPAQALAEAADEDHNIIARDAETRAGVFTINIPKYADSTEEQRRNRVMPDITWEALLSGAVHQVKTKGVLRVSL